MINEIFKMKGEGGKLGLFNFSSKPNLPSFADKWIETIIILIMIVNILKTELVMCWTSGPEAS